ADQKQTLRITRARSAPVAKTPFVLLRRPADGAERPTSSAPAFEGAPHQRPCADSSLRRDGRACSHGRTQRVSDFVLRASQRARDGPQPTGASSTITWRDSSVTYSGLKVRVAPVAC